MANENEMTVAQTNTVEPSQANKVINNIDKISDTQTPVSVLQSNRDIFNNDLKDSFFNSEAWKQYTSNDLRKVQPNIFPGFSAIEKAAENPMWAATLDRYGDAVATRQQALHSTYAKANNPLGRFGQAYNAQRYGLRTAAARKELSDAMMSGDEVRISEARNKYQNELKNQYERGYAYDDETANTLMSLLASSARNWETIPIEIAGALLAPYAFGISEVAARAINPAIVGADTYKLESGSALEQIDQLGIDMTEEQKREKSIPVGALNAAIEAGLFSMGGNIAGIGTRYIGTKVAKRTFKKSIEKRIGREISEEAANRLYQVKFLSELQKGAGKAGLSQFAKDIVLGGAGEGLQEVVQDTDTKAMMNAIQNDTSWGDELAKEWASFAANPFSAEHADKWKTFFNVMITSPVLSGVYRGVGAATDLVFKNNRQNKSNEVQTKFAGATNNTLGLSRLFEWHKNSDAKSAIGAANAALQEAINTDPNVTGKLYTTVEQVQQMQKDPEVAQALAQMGVDEGLQQASENGGVVELDLVAYDKIVNEKQNTVLFQKMRNYLSFSSTTMSVNEFNEFIKTNTEQFIQQINEEVKNNADSIYNKVRNMFLQAGENEAIANSYGAMAHIMLTGAQGFTQGQKNDILSRLQIKIGEQGTAKGQTLFQKIQYKGKEKNAFNDVFTADGKQVKYAEYGSDYNTGVNREAIKDDTNIKIINMSPQQFLNMTPKKMGNRDTTDLENAIKNGNEIAMPFLDVAVADAANKILKIVGHEGRHRSLAMQNLGVQNGYVILNSKDFYRQPSLFADGLKGWKLLPQGETNIDNAIELQGDARETSADLDIGGFVDAVFTEEQSEEPRVYHMFVGSRNQDVANDVADTLGKRKELDEARAMEKASIDKGEMPDYEAIWEKTGWYKEPDASWSYEVADNEASIDKSTFFKNGKARTGVHTTLGRAIKHDKLFDLFPALKDIAFHIGKSNTSGKQNSGNSIALYHSNNGKGQPEIIINASRIARHIKDEDISEQILSSVLHELQHEIDDKMSMMYYPQYRGDKEIRYGRLSSKEIKKIDELKELNSKIWKLADKYGVKIDGYNYKHTFAVRDQLLTAAQTEEEKQLVKDFVDKYTETADYNVVDDEGYYRTSTEVHARNTQHRIRMTEEQRKQVSPSATLDIAGKVQVGRSVTADELYKNTRVLRVMKFAGVPVSTQQQGQVEAGRTTAQAGQYEIALTPDANVVTFAHELFHVFSLELQRVYNSGNITDYWRKQAEKLYKIAGVNTATDSDVVLTESQEERLANLFTSFLMYGKIENREVRGLLSKLILMFKDAYKQLQDSGLTALAVDGYAKEFFNSIFTLEEDMTEIQMAAGLIAIEKPENVDRELYDFYVASIAESAVTASNDLNRKLYAIKAFKQNKKGDGKYKQMMDKFKDDARTELMQTDEYKVMAIGNMFKGADKAERTFERVQMEMPDANLTLGDVVKILQDTKPLEQEVNRIANAKMDAYITKEFKLTPQELSLKEDRNRAKVRALIAEDVMRKGGKLSDVEAELKKAEDAADKHMGNISVYQIIDEAKWKGRESASVDRYLWAKRQGRDDLMAAERFNQAVINLIMIKGRGFKSEYEKLTDLFTKLQTRQRKYEYKDDNGNVLGNEFRYNALDWELLRSISERFGNKIRDPRRSTKNAHQQLREWIDLQVAERFTTVKDLEAYMPFIDRGSDKSLGAMKGKDFKRLYTVMSIIDSVASREQALFIDGQYERMREYVDKTIKFHRDMNIKTDENREDWYDKFFGRYGTWQNPEPLLRAIFPPEVFQKIFLPLFQGGVTAEYTAKLWTNQWNEAKSKIDTSSKPFTLDDGTQITYKDGSFTKVMTHADVADLLLSMGANHAYENYKIKFGLTEEQAQTIASQALKRNKHYENFMKTAWEVYGKATELLNDSFQERTNELFVKKDHRAFEINGIKFEGGYVPEDKHYEALIREMGSQNTGVHNKRESKNEKLITKAADGQVMSIISITEMKLSQSAKWAFAAIPFNNVKKFVENEEVKAAMGKRAYKFIVDWLQNYDTPHFDVSGVWRPLNNLTTVSALSLKASTAVLQLSGIVQSISTVGTRYTARGALQFIRENGFFKPFELAKKKSVGLAQRLENPFSAYTGIEGGGRSFKDILNSYNAKTGIGKFGAMTLAAFQRLALYPIQLIDGYVAIITWNAAYTKALDKGLSETDAKAEADSVVRITQSDASQISRSAALQDPSARAITAFGTWFMAMRAQTKALSVSKKYQRDWIQWVVGYAVVGTFIEALLDEALNGDDDDDDDKKMVDKILNTWYNKLAETAGGYIMPFAGLGSSITKNIVGAVINEDDNKIIKTYTGGGVAALQYAWRLGDVFARGIKYAKTGEEEDKNKFLISTAGAFSNSLKKQVKKFLED